MRHQVLFFRDQKISHDDHSRLAEYFGTIGQHVGKKTNSQPSDDPRVRKFYADGEMPVPLDFLLKLKPDTFYDKEHGSDHYRESNLLVAFFMNDNDGAWRKDFLRFVRVSGRRYSDLAEVVVAAGLDEETFARRFKAWAMAAAEGALTHLLNPSGNKSKGFYFNPETIERALKDNDRTLLRAIMAKQAHRDNIEDDELLIGLMAHPDTRLAQEAGRTLFLRCQTRNKKLFQTMNPQSESDDAWPAKALSCIEAVERNLMPLREKALVQELD